MYTSEDVLEAARFIRPSLLDLLGAEAETVDRALAELLAKAESGEAVDNQILELLAERDPTREWTRQFLIDKIPPPVMRSYDPLEGSVSVIDANTFVCEDCKQEDPNNYLVWHRPKQGIDPPLCKKHNKPFVPAQPKTT
jgi:hypothetical protein